MKRSIKSLFAAALLLCAAHQPLMAQQPMPSVIPVDSLVRIGKLDNGLTYYIRRNTLPEKRVEFHIAQKVGAILEKPEQRGLAHFLEHMAFNGTQHFPGDERGPGIVAWCESKGIKFGTDLNAYTGIDETVYRVSNVPTDNESVIDSCLLIMHDWSSAIKLKENEIDKERGVIREEWRSRNSGMLRIMNNALPKLFAGTKYDDCMPIGSIDVINNFPYQLIRDYYRTWYRPDQQGIIIVGDIDVDVMEAKLKKTFADVKAAQNPAERIYYPVNDNQETILFVGTDKEVSTPSVNIFFKHPAFPREMKNDINFYVNNYLIHMAVSMLNTRLAEIRMKSDAPFTDASVSFGEFFVAKTKSSFTVSVESKIDGIDQAAEAVLAEVERARRFGFTATEYERTRTNYLQSMESAYNERNNVKNMSYAEAYIRHFIDNDPIPNMEYEYKMMKMIVSSIPVEAINKTMASLVTENNRAVLMAGPDKEGITYSTDHIAKVLQEMPQMNLQPYEDQVNDAPLLAEEPQGGKIVSEEANQIYGTTKLTLSNGIVVYVKPTDFKADQIMMQGTSKGGNSLFDDAEALNFQQINSVALLGGLGNFNRIELGKVLAGKRANVSASVGTTTENISGSCAPRDFETMMQLTYLTFTAPRKDEDTFLAYKNQLKAGLHNADANPMTAFNDTLSQMLYGNHPRAQMLREEMVDNLNYDRIIQLYQDRFKEAGDFTFFLVGNIDIEAIKPLLAKYLGGLPTIGRKEDYRIVDIDKTRGVVKKQFAQKQETPMATILSRLIGNCDYNMKNIMTVSILNQALDMVYTEEIREKEGGTYGVSCQGSLRDYPREELSLQIFFQTDPGKAEHLSNVVMEQLKKMAAEGPQAEHMKKIKDYMTKSFHDAQKENSYWMRNLNTYFDTGIDFNKGYLETLNSITQEDVRQMLDNLLKQNNLVQLIMTAPEEK